jgi:hypothetical protein
MQPEIDGHGWKRSALYATDRELTPKRSALMKEAIAVLHCEAIMLIAKGQWFMAATHTHDTADMMQLYDMMLHRGTGGMELALQGYSNLDTAARDRFPQWVAEMAGSWINPSGWNEEESLDATR